jgi:hypothetical protein
MHNSNHGSQLYTNVQQKSRSLSVSEYSDVGGDSDQDVDDDFVGVEEKWTNKPLLPIQNTVQPTLSDCGLCGQRHHGGSCVMVARSENLAEYREMLIFHADDEPWEERVGLMFSFNFNLVNPWIKCAAVQAIDEILVKRSHVHLIAGQPLHPLTKPVPGPPPKRIKSAQNEASKGRSTSSQTSAPPSPCILCHSNSPHHYKDCSVIQAGPKRWVNRSVTFTETKLIVRPQHHQSYSRTGKPGKWCTDQYYQHAAQLAFQSQISRNGDSEGQHCWDKYLVPLHNCASRHFSSV